MSKLAILYLICVANVITRIGGRLVPRHTSSKDPHTDHLSSVVSAGVLSRTAMEDVEQFWLIRLLLNLLGYATVIVPSVLVIFYLRRIKYNERAGSGPVRNLISLCVFGRDAQKLSLEEGGMSSPLPADEQSFKQKSSIIIFCFLGLQASYLTWGVLQERIMTIKYGETEGSPGSNFTNSQFLVFMNRILAFVIAGLIICVRRQPQQTAPLYKYSFSSISNIMSSWFQYEALKFVSFPTQVLAKASKVIPVMIMGKIVYNKTYEYYEYVTAILLSFGVGMFLLTSSDVTHDSTKVTTLSGVILLVAYMIFDSFTSNWQGKLFKQYSMSSVQMMAGVNMFSCIFTAVSLLEQGGFLDSLQFMAVQPLFIVHVVVLSICSATGQLFIFYTISKFGPVVFVIMMTVRQALAILLSCFIYSHPVTLIGLFGILIVFVAIFLRIYAGQRLKQKRAMKNVALISTTRV